MTPDPHLPSSAGTRPPDPYDTELPSDEEPVTTGTLFLMLVFLMLIGGIWGVMYWTLLHR